MDFEKVITMRQSCRKFQDKSLTNEQINALLEAANTAPIGSALYKDIHITVVKNQKLLLHLCEAAWARFSSEEKVKEVAGEVLDRTPEEAKCPKPNLFYNAPVVFFISHRKQTLQPGIEWSNVTSVVNTMHLAATDFGLGSVYMWGALESMRMIPALDYTSELHIPDGFEPLLALAVGYPTEPLNERLTRHEPFSINRID